MSTIKLIGNWVITMSVAAGVGIGLAIIWGVAATAVAIEDIKW